MINSLEVNEGNKDSFIYRKKAYDNGKGNRIVSLPSFHRVLYGETNYYQLLLGKSVLMIPETIRKKKITVNQYNRIMKEINKILEED
jgi:hypothetical protein